MPKLRRSQTGTRNTSGVAKKSSKLSKVLHPWGGPNLPFKSGGRNGVRGSSTRKIKSDPRLAPQTKGYPRNQPSQWPVEIDKVGHTLAPPLSGYVDDVADANNAAVNHAFKRGGYPEA